MLRLGIGGRSFPWNRNAYMNVCAGTIRFDFHLAMKLTNTLTHAPNPDSRTARLNFEQALR